MSLRPRFLPLALVILGLGTSCGEPDDPKPHDSEPTPDDTAPEWPQFEDADGDGWTVADGDCDDGDPTVSPQQNERCNGLDDNCNDRIDEGYGDADGDSVADCVDSEECDGVDNDGDGVADEDFADNDGDGIADCVDSEACDGIDNDGDGDIDEGYDADGDGFTQCGDATTQADCDDSDAAVNPDATEVVGNVQDDDCDGMIDEGSWAAGDLVFTELMVNPAAVSDLYGEWIELENHAGHGLYLDGLTLVSTSGSHTITSATPLWVEAGAIVVLGRSTTARNGGVAVDYVYDVVGMSNEGDELILKAGEVELDSVTWDDGATMPDPVGASIMLDPWWELSGDHSDPALWCASTQAWAAGSDLGTPGSRNGSCPGFDHDEDGYTGDDGDCDDLDPAINPGAVEIWYDGVDGDCDEHSDYDADYDGFDSDAWGGTDCDDTTDTVRPDADEYCDTVDNNCSGDELDALDTVYWYLDADQDGHGDPANLVDICAPPEGYVATATDCDDSDPTIYTGADEAWYDGIDSNCDTLSDYDADYDGFDSDAYGGADCDDTNPVVNPDADEYCDELDNDCDGDTDEEGAVDATRWYWDLDEDGDGDPSNYVDACTQPSGTVTESSDCDDTSPAIFDCAPGLSQDNPGTSCADILSVSSYAPDGLYWLDPDGDGDTTDAYQVWCDMTSYGGGWAYIYWVDAEHFDGSYAVNRTTNLSPPTAINDQRDLWNASTELTVSEVLFGCTTQNDAASHYWYYADGAPYTYFTSTTDYSYVTHASVASSTTAGVCFSTHKAESSHGFMVIESSSCGSCRSMLYGAYHYTSGGGCNSTSTTYGTHPSPWDSRSIQYPICAGTQTSNGSFFIAVR